MQDFRRLLLLSNSTVHGRGYLDHAQDAIRSFLEPRSKILFVPFALFDRDAYAAQARRRFEAMGFALESIHDRPDPRAALESAHALFVGGGNTFRLLRSLQEGDWIAPIRARIAAGMRYIGSSAGTVVSAPTIRTTNDMPIVEPASLSALGLVEFQINAHFLDPDPASTHMGETREERLRQYHEENDPPVLGLREGSWLAVDAAEIALGGPLPARLFRKNKEPTELPPGSRCEDLLK